MHNALELDSTDIKIVKELMVDPDVSSMKIAKKLVIPLSTIQRRKTRLERSVLRKKYVLDTESMGWRSAEILMLIENGKANHMAQELLQKFDNIIRTSTRINSGANLAACVRYKHSNDLHELMESIRRTPNVTNIQWTEVVRETGNENERIANLVFNSSKY